MKQFAKIVTLSIVPLLVFILVNQSVNIHYHKLDDGVVISHAHPYTESNDMEGTPFQEHKHTKFQYFLLAQLSSMFVPLMVLALLSLAIFSFHKRNLTPAFQAFVEQTQKCLFLLRAPPVIV
ncbi:MAG: hypothetical protein R6U66_04965 [Bacteroidales bacterium]